VLGSEAAWVDSEVGEQAVGGGHGRQHPRGETLVTRPADGLVADAGEDARMPVKGQAGMPPLPDRFEDLLYNVCVDLGPRPPFAVVLLEGTRSRPQLFQPGGRTGVGKQVEDVVGILQDRPRLGRQVDAELDTGADDG
jgi:hypothetical protein